MSRHTDREQRVRERERGVLGLESSLDALRASPEFTGPVEGLDGHESNDHLALIYEDQEEQFAAAIPFMRQGLERGERCMYIADENSREEVLEAMRGRGIDVDAALGSGALSIHTKRDTYLKDGEFVPRNMIEFLDAVITDATEVEEYEGLRIAGEMTWVLGDGASSERLLEYECGVNELLPRVDAIALCQYNRERFPGDLLYDVIRTHPHLIYDDTVCQNFYYTPPEEFFGPERSAREIDRMMETLLDRTEAKTELQERERYLRRQNAITASPDRSFEDKLQAMFDLGCERFGLELGAMAFVDPETDGFEIEYTSGEHEHFAPGTNLPLSETYCTAVTENKGPASVSNPLEDGYENITVHSEFGLKAYLGTYVEVDGGLDRTFFFVSSQPRDEGFSGEERTFHDLMGLWVQYELERKHREADLEETVERLERSNAELKRFAHAASHDLQEPLRMVSSYLQLLEQRYGDDLDADAREYIEFAVDGADRMREMIDALLEYSRLDQNGSEFERIDCDAALDKALDNLQVAIEESDADITSDSLPRVTGDQEQLIQLFQNLLDNAITYAGDEPPRVHVSAAESYGEWVLSVRDHGIGIDPDKAEEIFEVFNRLHTNHDYEGTGIGLALCQRIVDLHDGRIWVDSEPGEGSTFYVTVPKR